MNFVSEFSINDFLYMIKGLGNSNGRTFFSYQVFVDNDAFVDRICIMTERNCHNLLDWLLELVYQSK